MEKLFLAAFLNPTRKQRCHLIENIMLYDTVRLLLMIIRVIYDYFKTFHETH